MTYSHWDDENALNNYRNSQVFFRLWNKIKPHFEINLKHGAMKFILMDFILKRLIKICFEFNNRDLKNLFLHLFKNTIFEN